MANLGLFNGPMGPAYNATQTTTQDDLDNQLKAANINQMLLRNQMSQQSMPLELEQKSLENQRTAAQIPGIQGQSQISAAQGKTAEENQPLSSKANAQQIMSNMSDSQLKQMSDFGEMLSNVGSTMKQLPQTPANGQIFQNFMSRLGIPDDHPVIQELNNVSPEKLPDTLVNIGKSMTENSSRYTMQAGMVGLQNQGKLGVANIRASSQEDIAQQKIQAQNAWEQADNATKLQIAQEANKLKQYLLENKVLNTDQLVAKLQQAYQNDPSEDNRMKLKQATDVQAYLNSTRGNMVDMYQKGQITQNLLGSQLAPNTVPQPQNPVDSQSFRAAQPGPGVTGPAQTPVPQPQAQTPPPQAQAPAVPASAPAPASVTNGKPAMGGFEVGKTYKGKTGSFTYLGGDPSDKSNWK